MSDPTRAIGYRPTMATKAVSHKARRSKRRKPNPMPTPKPRGRVAYKGA